jgi:RimJ/RimL family protein N-acetyltransferase
VNTDDHTRVVPQTVEIFTKRLHLRPWSLADTEAALEIFGSRQVSRWLTPALTQIDTCEHMQIVLESWVAENNEKGRPLGRWAIEHKDTGVLVGAVSLLPLPPEGIDLEIGWQVAPRHWGQGYGAEAGHGVAHQAFTAGATEVFAVVRPGNHRGIATARRVGMEWIGETTKYYGLALQVYRVTKADLDYPTGPEATGQS